MSDYGRSAAEPGQREPERSRLDKRAWKDIRRARALGDDGSLYAVEVHGVKIFFRWTKTLSEQCPQDTTPCGRAPAKARDVSNRDAQPLPVRKSKPPNSRQRRSAKRLQDYIRHRWGVVPAREAQLARDDGSPSGGASVRDSRARKGVAGSPETTAPAAVACDSAQAAVPHGTARQQALAGDSADEAEELYREWSAHALATGDPRPEGARTPVDWQSDDEASDDSMAQGPAGQLLELPPRDESSPEAVSTADEADMSDSPAAESPADRGGTGASAAATRRTKGKKGKRPRR